MPARRGLSVSRAGANVAVMSWLEIDRTRAAPPADGGAAVERAAPARALERFVARIDVRRAGPGAPPRAVDLLPDGTTNLVLRVHPDGSSDASVRGPVARLHAKLAPRLPLVVHVQLAPGGAYPFFGVPVDTLAGGLVSLDDLWGGEAVALRRALAERAASAPGEGRDRSVAALVEGALVERMRRTPYEPGSALAVREAVRLLDAGARSIDEIARAIGLSERHLRRSFQSVVGVAPKAYARMARLRRALALHRVAVRPWSEIARAAGYFDQAHMAADFRDLLRRSPAALGKADLAPRGAC